MSFTIRRIQDAANHSDVINPMQLECLPFDDPYQTTKGQWWIVYDEAKSPAAFACLTKSHTTPGGGYLARAGVRPQFRGKGLQKRLIRVRVNEARRRGYHTLVTDTTENNPSANNLIACGFRLFTPVKEWGFEHTLYWKMKLGQIKSTPDRLPEIARQAVQPCLLRADDAQLDLLEYDNGWNALLNRGI